MARPLASLRSRVFAATAVVAVLPVAAALFFVTRRVAQQAEAELDRGLGQAARLVEQYHSSLIEAATERKLPSNFSARMTATTLMRLRAELCAVPHAAHALTWLRGPKCVASSSTLDRIRLSLETTGLARFFNDIFSASDVPYGKPAPDLFLHAASQMGIAAQDCIVVEDSPAGVSAATAAGMAAIGFVGSSHAGGELGGQLIMAGARTIVTDLRHLKSTVVALRGW
jgi:HAD superfamily hydrolase (TIGR01509 family)